MPSLLTDRSSSSLTGFRGIEDLGGGLQASFNWEAFVQAGTQTIDSKETIKHLSGSYVERTEYASSAANGSIGSLGFAGTTYLPGTGFFAGGQIQYGIANTKANASDNFYGERESSLKLKNTGLAGVLVGYDIGSMDLALGLGVVRTRAEVTQSSSSGSYSTYFSANPTLKGVDASIELGYKPTPNWRLALSYNQTNYGRYSAGPFEAGAGPGEGKSIDYKLKANTVALTAGYLFGGQKPAYDSSSWRADDAEASSGFNRYLFAQAGSLNVRNKFTATKMYNGDTIIATGSGTQAGSGSVGKVGFGVSYPFQHGLYIAAEAAVGAAKGGILTSQNGQNDWDNARLNLGSNASFILQPGISLAQGVTVFALGGVSWQHVGYSVSGDSTYSSAYEDGTQSTLFAPVYGVGTSYQVSKRTSIYALASQENYGKKNFQFDLMPRYTQNNSFNINTTQYAVGVRHSF